MNSSGLFWISFCLLLEGSASMPGHNHGDRGERLQYRDNPSDDDLLEEIATVVRTSLDESMPLLQSMTSDRLPFPMARAILTNYGGRLGFGDAMGPLIRGMEQREDLDQALLLFMEMGNAMGNAILEGLKKQKEERTYTFLFDAICNCPLHYIEDGASEMKGFCIDIVEEVCRAAGKTCFIQQAPYDMCFKSGTGERLDGIGDGISSGQYDGCIAANNPGVTNSMALTDVFELYSGPSRYYVPVGNPGKFNADDISGKKIGFISGWPSNRNCLVGNKVNGAETLGPEQMLYFDSTREFLASMENKKIDAAFVYQTWPEDGVDDKDLEMLSGTPDGLEPVGDVMYCFNGTHIGTRKDSPVIEWFNAGLKTIMESGKYAQLCRKARTEYGSKGRIDCVF